MIQPTLSCYTIGYACNTIMHKIRSHNDCCCTLMCSKKGYSAPTHGVRRLYNDMRMGLVPILHFSKHFVAVLCGKWLSDEDGRAIPLQSFLVLGGYSYVVDYPTGV